MTVEDKRSRPGIFLIAFLLSAESAMLWVGKWRWALFYLALHVATSVLIVGLTYAGFEPLQSWAKDRWETPMLIANAIVALPAFIHASRFLDEPAGNQWFSKWYVVVAAYAMIGIAMYSIAKPFLSA
jgi:hypothetical protein